MKKTTVFLVSLILSVTVFSQVKFNPDTVNSRPFDNGKMWTFDNPPVDYFAKTYQFKPTAQWLQEVQMSALRFATYCSASFVSAILSAFSFFQASTVLVIIHSWGEVIS